jgi:N-acetylglucosamine-6-phosphate deacetylase
VNDRLTVHGGTTIGRVGGPLALEGARIVSAIGGGRRRDSRFDAEGLLVAPGFVDVQINGGFGHDFTTGPGAIWAVGARLPWFGLTAFLPTLVSPRAAEVEAALAVLAAGPPPGYPGAIPLGLHVEGPMLSPRRRGVHARSRLRAPSLELITGWTRDRGVRLVTLAPELPGAGRVVRTLRRRGVVVSAGHSDATFEQARRAFAQGVAFGTHLFNGMSGWHHRQPGLAGALLATRGVRAGLIADGHHVHPGTLELAWRLKGPGEIVLVSDASPIAGGRGRSGAGLRVGGGVARDERGVIAGGLAMLDAAVRQVVGATGCDPADAIRAASTTPAELLAERSRGRIRAGARADLVLLDERLRVAATIVGGRVRYDRDGRISGE